MLTSLILAALDVIDQQAAAWTELDRHIGDADHGENMRYGAQAVASLLPSLSSLPMAEQIRQIGLALTLSVGGASGPLYGTLLLRLGEALAEPQPFRPAFGEAVAAVAARGRVEPGDKTLYDVLHAVHAMLLAQHHLSAQQLAMCARHAADATVPWQARRGRAAFLGKRSVGHMDPGACSMAQLIEAICMAWQQQRGELQ